MERWSITLCPLNFSLVKNELRVRSGKSFVQRLLPSIVFHTRGKNQ